MSKLNPGFRWFSLNSKFLETGNLETRKLRLTMAKYDIETLFKMKKKKDLIGTLQLVHRVSEKWDISFRMSKFPGFQWFFMVAQLEQPSDFKFHVY